MTRVLLVALTMCGCATINTAGMSERCRSIYNGCLNNCPGAQRPGGTQAPNAVHPGSNLDVEDARCTASCNESAKSCK